MYVIQKRNVFGFIKGPWINTKITSDTYEDILTKVPNSTTYTEYNISEI